MPASRKIVALALAGVILAGLGGAAWLAGRPRGAAGPAADDPPPIEVEASAGPRGLDAAPAEVRELLDRVLAELPPAGAGVSEYRFRHWERAGKPTREAFGIKPVPGLDPGAMIDRILDVDGYEGRVAHVEESRSRPDPAFPPPGRVRAFQRIRVPGVARVQQELALVDAGTTRGYRVVYWYLLPRETAALDPAGGARGAFNVGAWLVAPGVVGYALSSWPDRADLNALQWVSLTRGADGLASAVVEGTIDGMAAWAGEDATHKQ